MNVCSPCALVLALLASACSTTPHARYDVLAALSAQRGPATSVSVLVEPVTAPAKVDRQQIVSATGANEVAIEDLYRWGSPLQDNIAEVLAGDLSAQLGTWTYRLHTRLAAPTVPA